ncbi:Tripartite DNA replication factor [Mactra antiquata]
MGKIKKPPSASKDEGQKKISSFFQQGSNKSTAKSLFCEHGKIVDKKITKPLSESKSVTSLPVCGKVSSKTDSNISSPVTCIPDTQVLVTPPCVKGKSKRIDGEGNNQSNNVEVSDFGIIPDTPETKKEDPIKSKRPLARSFLLSTSQFGSNPIQKAKENREAKLALKKKTCLAKKGLLSVCVQFNNEENRSGNMTGGITDTNSVIDLTDSIPQVNGNSKPLEVTPTKIYSNGDTLKRMAKSGDSPDGKRTVNESESFKKQLSFKNDAGKLDLNSSSEDSILTKLKNEKASASEIMNINQVSKEEMVKRKKKEELLTAKRQKELERALERKRVEKEENRRKIEKLMKYQLAGSTDLQDKYSDTTLANDDTLDDILQELTSPRLAKPSVTSKTIDVRRSAPFTKTKFQPVNNHVKKRSHDGGKFNADVEKLSDSFNTNWTADDDEYFSKLNVDFSLNKNTVTTVTKAESVEIEHFPTQDDVGGQRSRTQEMEIEEFVSQMNDDFDIEDTGLTPNKHSHSASIRQTEAPSTLYNRHVVTNVTLSDNKQQIILDLTSQPADINRQCILHDFWLDSHVSVGDTVHVLGEFIDNKCHITDTSGLLVINPDLLLSGTTVVSSVFCMRKSILKEKFKGCDSKNIQMLYGSIIHSVFQQLLEEKDVHIKNCLPGNAFQMLKNKLHTADAITKEAEKIVHESNNLLEMYANNVEEDKVMEEIKNYIPQMLSWVQQYTLFNGGKSVCKKSSESDVKLTDVYDIEENIWSPRFGIKGKIDLTVKAKTQNDRNVSLLPLELKTGKTSYSVEHKGQVTLYSMMCGDRREDPKKGLLLYLKEPSMKIIPAEHLHQRGLIQLRNEMAYYISRRVEKCDTEDRTFTLGRLPDPITNIRACQKCPQLINCSIYQRHVEHRPSNSSGISGLVNETLGHLTSDHVTYFLQWCLMLDLESKLDDSKKTVADIWCKSSTQREEKGLCLSGMILLPDSCETVADDAVILTFTRHRDNNKSSISSCTGINKQDSVVISCENPVWIAVCTGFIQDISSNTIQVLSDRDSIDRMFKMKDKIFRIDKCDNFSTAGIMYTNVSKLMIDDQHSSKLRRLIIDKVKPEFTNTLSKTNIEKVKTIFKQLNKPQKSAILKVLMCKDYVLIRGYPGTGKTSTIVALVKILYKLGQSVLLTSYTHSAVDNILLKLKKDGINFLRLGRVSKIHRDIVPYSWDKLTSGITSVDGLEKFISSQQIVSSSCLGMNHPMFTTKQFDVCIIDEASQVLQPACLGPIFTSKRFVLVGDPKQLPPVVRSKDAKDLGMDQSLFSHLDDLGATFDLNVQYRMNSAIMAISNKLVYNDCLKCGCDTVANRTLDISRSEVTECIIAKVSWMKEVYDGSLSKSVIVLNTKNLPGKHSKVPTGGFTNETECKLVINCVNYLCKAGVQEDDVGVIAPYSSQVHAIRERLNQGHTRSKVEVNTVDQYQGRDKNIIIISFVLSSELIKAQVGELLQDLRRLNVAVTRAKVKLILIGNVTYLSQYIYLKQLFDLIPQENIVMLDNV